MSPSRGEIIQSFQGSQHSPSSLADDKQTFVKLGIRSNIYSVSHHFQDLYWLDYAARGAVVTVLEADSCDLTFFMCNMVGKEKVSFL